MTSQQRRSSQVTDAPWISLFVVSPETPLAMHHETLTLGQRFRKLSAQVCLAHYQPITHHFPALIGDGRNTLCVKNCLLRRPSNTSVRKLQKGIIGERQLSTISLSISFPNLEFEDNNSMKQPTDSLNIKKKQDLVLNDGLFSMCDYTKSDERSIYYV